MGKDDDDNSMFTKILYPTLNSFVIPATTIDVPKVNDIILIIQACMYLELTVATNDRHVRITI